MECVSTSAAKPETWQRIHLVNLTLVTVANYYESFKQGMEDVQTCLTGKCNSWNISVQVFLFCRFEYFEILHPILFALPEHHVHEAADERHRETDPGQDVRGTVGAFPETLLMKWRFLSSVDGGTNQHT